MEISETKHVEKCAKEGGYSLGANGYMVRYSGNIFLRYMKPGNVLELGPAEGLMTDILYPLFPDYTAVDGAEFFIKDLMKRYPSIKTFVSLFEDFEPSVKYQNIVLGHVLEHVISPVAILSKISKWLLPEGKVFIAVPNANSLHRQAAVSMGLLSSIEELNETDKRNGHRRVYRWDTLRQDLLSAGLKIDVMGGYWLKPLSNAQIERDWDESMINAYFALGETYPTIAAEIYAVATLP